MHVVFLEMLDHFQTTILDNRCPITRSTYITLLADMFEGISEDKFKFCNRYSSDGWQLFTQYIHEHCPEYPAFALEVAEKRRCRLLIRRFEESVDGISVEPDISQTIFANMSDSGVPHHPEHADQMLRKTGRFMSSLIKEDINLTATVTEMIATWSRALQLALDDDAVSLPLSDGLLPKLNDY